jgi:hypothetical protein
MACRECLCTKFIRADAYIGVTRSSLGTLHLPQAEIFVDIIVRGQGFADDPKAS